MGKYDDMIDMEHHVSLTHMPMSAENRAAQFAAFAALSGYEDAVRETGRYTVQKSEIDEDMKEIINNRLLIINDCIDKHYTISVTYFIPDKLKSGGKYNTAESYIKKIDIEGLYIIIADDTKIDINEITDISGEIFKDSDLTVYYE